MRSRNNGLSLTIGKKMTKWNDPIHPGEVLQDELDEIDLNGAQLARIIDVPENRIYQILNCSRSLTADTALRLGKFFGTGPEFWINLQKHYELDVAKLNIGVTLDSIVPYSGIGKHC